MVNVNLSSTIVTKSVLRPAGQRTRKNESSAHARDVLCVLHSVVHQMLCAGS